MLAIEEPPPAPTRGFALWNLGFRPFYLLASAFAALSIALWALEYAGWLPRGYLEAPSRHGHEMLFGFALAVVAGFLFTAVRNWTGKPTPTGGWLAAIALVWVAARVAMVAASPLVAGILNAAFPIAVAIGIAIPLARSGNRRNYFFVPLLAAAGLAALAMHLAAIGVLPWEARTVSLSLGLDIVMFIIAVMAGRVVPMFTGNAIPGAGATRNAWIERAALGGVLAIAAVDLLDGPPRVLVPVALAAAAANAARLALWRPWKTAGTPLVWILHAAYAWIPIHLALRACAALGVVAPQFATHALTIGAIGGMTIGMMTRTARGHTGRPLVADRWEVACYALVQLAAIVRVFGGLAWTRGYLWTVLASAALWSLAFGIYTVRYWPILTRPRIDGRP
ncbi:MAG TPA: NnrS family protein, partial [Usitatibacter sp.]|nr:NnrS family protein [Usitatibacter sp.]